MRRLVLLVMLLVTAPAFAQEAGLTWQEAVKRLAREREFAENGVAQLKRWAPDDAARAKGRQLYSDAKGSSDGFIEALLVGIAESTPPDKSADITRELDAAVDQRIAFSRYVNGFVPGTDGGKPFILDALSAAAGDIVTSLTEGGIEIWKEFHRTDELRRQTIANRLEKQKWPRFDEVGAAQ